MEDKKGEFLIYNLLLLGFKKKCIILKKDNLSIFYHCYGAWFEDFMLFNNNNNNNDNKRFKYCTCCVNNANSIKTHVGIDNRIKLTNN